jgi:hypothetical protein
MKAYLFIISICIFDLSANCQSESFFQNNYSLTFEYLKYSCGDSISTNEIISIINGMRITKDTVNQQIETYQCDSNYIIKRIYLKDDDFNLVRIDSIKLDVDFKGNSIINRETTTLTFYQNLNPGIVDAVYNPIKSRKILYDLSMISFESIEFTDGSRQENKYYFNSFSEYIVEITCFTSDNNIDRKSIVYREIINKR